ncbi:MAG: ATP-binding protein [Acidobacteriia bacterium]|nr:ATP-binding protein [Terriglobia bacterium]
MRRLSNKWNGNTGWKKKLEWISIHNLRGWTGQTFKLDYPIMAVVGENGAGKSTILQCAAAVYNSTAPKFFLKGRGYASDYFPKTAWDHLSDVQIKYSAIHGDKRVTDTIRRPTTRWRGNRERVERPVVYIDLSRILPVSARVGYSKIAKTQHTEIKAVAFEQSRLARFSQIMGRSYESAKMASADIDPERPVPVMGYGGARYSGFHGGAGETTILELIQTDVPPGSLVLIDELETSLHPRVQRRVIRDLAEKARENDLQIILTTHSPFILTELPETARAQIMLTKAGRQIVYGVSPEFAMSKMDDVPQYECEIYVEDRRAQALVIEVLFHHAKSETVSKCRTLPYGAGSVGKALGIMVSQDRFPRPTVVFIDGDQGEAIGCITLPGQDAPERVVFEQLKDNNWRNVAMRTGRNYTDLEDARIQAMAIKDAHEWVRFCASKLIVSSDLFWQAMCAEWAANCISAEEAKGIVQPIEDALIGIRTIPKEEIAAPGVPPKAIETPSYSDDSSETLPLFPQ